MERCLHDQFLPEYDFSEYHETQINATRDAIVATMMRGDFTKSWIIRLLFRLRGLPSNLSRGLVSAEEMGFCLLAKTDSEIMLGLIGQFWKPSGVIQKVLPAQFVSCTDPAFARATWNFKITGNAPPYTLSTETRILCPSKEVQKKFGRYWLFIRPFSGLIRREMLKSIKRSVLRD